MNIRLPSILVLLCTIPSVVVGAVLGIDYGQANTKAALVSPGLPFEIVLTRDSKRKDVSGIAFKDDERIYGSGAATFSSRFPQDSFLNFKSLLGRSVDSAEALVYLEQHPGISLVPSGNRSTISFKASNDGVFSTEEILAMSLTHIKELADQMLPKGSISKVHLVSLTVPAFFDNIQRRAIIDATEIAGLKVVSLVSDGVAVGINYASSRSFPEKQYHIIFDVGAGSTTATLLSFLEYDAPDVGKFTKSALNITVEGFGYDATLGGDILTQRIFEILKARFIAQHGSGVESSPKSLVRLYKEAERAKSILSANTEVRSGIESLYEDLDFRTVLTRVEFEKSIEDILPRLQKPILDSLRQAGISISEVSSIILNGGSTRVPIFQQTLIEKILAGDSSRLSKNVNADEAAVMGATFRAVSVSKQFKTKDINIIEPTLWDVDVLFQDPQTGAIIDKQILYPKGTITGITGYGPIDLKLPTGFDNLTLLFRENEKSLYQYDLQNILVAKNKTETGNDCTELSLVLDSDLSLSRIFDVHGVSWVCNFTLPPPPPPPSSSEEEENLKQKVVKTPVRYRVSYPGSRNLGRATKATSQARLRQFDKLDQERLHKEATRNDVESFAYKIRDRIENNHEKTYEHSTEQERQNFLQLAEAALEWLYEESESLVIESLTKRLKELKRFEELILEREKRKLRDLKKQIEEVLKQKREQAAEFLYDSETGSQQQQPEGSPSPNHVEEPAPEPTEQAESIESTTVIPKTESQTTVSESERPTDTVHDEL
ncbi:Hsp70 protein-domain-containing protein [Lipomyces japonicus]|uniref:Hsp70 protein-domain-containing protein n=1 Tax=Lipomyces japonicus TaxID=56871 RepID=UPI0034CF3048